MQIEIITATRYSLADFQTKSALGQSLERMADPHIALRLIVENKRGLPAVYNDCMAAAGADNILVFMHDDVWIDDYFFVQRIIAGLAAFDLIGIAGNLRRRMAQPTWQFLDSDFTADSPENLSGHVAHGEKPFGEISRYGPVPAACEILDGVLLAARKSILAENDLRFDTRFDFHFYDMDFCREARECGLKLGTWPIALTHQSEGVFGRGPWLDAYKVYLTKWGS
jgi:GT2 family glycosyltransferase